MKPLPGPQFPIEAYENFTRQLVPRWTTTDAPDKVKALVAVEPGGVDDPAQAAALKGMPILALFGDNIERDARWAAIRANAVKFLEAVRVGGARVEIRDLSKAGVRGNSHMMMMDKNSLEVANVIQTWLEREGLWR
jgi:pimeloyl-ACP methyl ester carboxylesterase